MCTTSCHHVTLCQSAIIYSSTGMCIETKAHLHAVRSCFLAGLLCRCQHGMSHASWRIQYLVHISHFAQTRGARAFQSRPSCTDTSRRHLNGVSTSIRLGHCRWICNEGVHCQGCISRTACLVAENLHDQPRTGQPLQWQADDSAAVDFLQSLKKDYRP